MVLYLGRRSEFRERLDGPATIFAKVLSAQFNFGALTQLDQAVRLVLLIIRCQTTY